MKTIFNPQKPFLWLLIVAVMAAVILCVLFIPRPVDVPDGLDQCVRSTLCEVHYSSHTEGKYPAVTYTALATEKKGDEVTLYGVMMYREYTATTLDKLEIWGAAHYPFAITATDNGDGTYTATDCWWPEDGANHVSSIKKKFPTYCASKAADYGQFYTEHDAACNAAATAGIAEDEKYTVLKSERDNIRLGYCVKTATAYINFSGGYITDGSYEVENGQAVFTFGERKVAFAIESGAYVFDKEASANIPAVWEAAGDTKYFTEGVRFVLDDGNGSFADEETAPVGATVTVTNNSSMDETALREMFGQYVPSTYFDSENPKYLPVRPIETYAQLQRFLAAYSAEWSGLTAENFAQYDETFFEENYLMITYYKDGMASCFPKIDSYVFVQDGSSLWLSVRLEVQKPAAGDTVVGQWLLFSGIAKEDFEKSNALEAYVETTIPMSGYVAAYAAAVQYPEGAFEKWRQYYSAEDEQALRAVLTRLDQVDGWFDSYTLDRVLLYVGAFEMNGLHYITQDGEALVRADGQCAWLTDEEAALCVRLLSGVTEENTAQTSGALSFTGTVTQVDGHAMLMETDDVPQFNSGVWVELGDTPLAPVVGETYTVTYEDIVMPSLPPRITAITISKP